MITTITISNAATIVATIAGANPTTVDSNTIISYIVLAMFLGMCIWFVSVLTIDMHKSRKESKLLKAYRDDELKNEMINNDLLHHWCKSIRYKDSDGTTLIYSEYAFGRWYIYYEHLGIEHFSVVRSYKKDGEPWEDYAKVNTKYGFHNEAAKDEFGLMEMKVAALAGNKEADTAWYEYQNRELL